jgi:diaminohydroxyphosphoribosylaminopyrimidine deaminase/5-amino-6-(5-phosphoribosylamino)uracil reductase
MQISNEQSMEVVHRLRARCDAVLVGINTVLTDDPQLTARGVTNPRPLLRCVLDRKLRTPLESKLVQTAQDSRVIIGCDSEVLTEKKADALRAAGVELICISGISEFLFNLRNKWKVSHLLVEPGPMLARAFFDGGLADRLWVFTCARSANDETAPNAALIPPSFRESGTLDLDGDILHEYFNSLSRSYFATVPSADLELEASGAGGGRPRPSGLG